MYVRTYFTAAAADGGVAILFLFFHHRRRQDPQSWQAVNLALRPPKVKGSMNEATPPSRTNIATGRILKFDWGGNDVKSIEQKDSSNMRKYTSV